MPFLLALLRRLTSFCSWSPPASETLRLVMRLAFNSTTCWVRLAWDAAR